ncbi:hypothetical protein H4582DRAFT_2086901 [Lactarius indigo]|nr:hypothetical protein H4582DRAFT_2086901 [Lactarius indigo]
MLSTPFTPRSPLAHKRRQLDAIAGLGLSSPSFCADDDIEDEDDSDNEEEEMAVFASLSSGSCGLDPPPSGLPLPGPPDRVSAGSSAHMQQAIDDLEAASQDVRFRVARNEQSDKTTAATYRRHVDAYTFWWDAYQASVLNEDPTQVAIPAFPITPAKATMFLEYTSTRPKRRHGSSERIPGSVVGASVIKQTISALEHHRLEHQHIHTQTPEAQIGLRLVMNSTHR